jgi:hypothetical protein
MTIYIPEHPGFLPRGLYTCTVEERVWATTRMHWWVDGDGTPWAMPEGFHFDMYSSPRLLWFLRPPSNGRDIPALFHDGMRRAHKLMGLEVREIDLRMFRRQIRDSGGTKRAAQIKGAAVWGAWNCGIARCDGMGWHDSPEKPHPFYDRPVIDHDGTEMSFEAWVRRHYLPDGRGWRAAV